MMKSINIGNVEYLSRLDEEYFFSWAQRIVCVEKTHAGFMYIDESLLDEENLRELIALFQRYNGPLKELASFCNVENEKWFKNPDSYWYKNVFKIA